MPLAMRPLRDQMAHCRRTTVQPSALTRSPPTFKRRQAACESLAGRLHSEVKVWLGGSTPNEITSCLRTSRSSCSLSEGDIWMQNAKAPLSLGSPQSGAVWGPHRKNFRWGQSEHALRGKGATARKQKESRSFERLSCSLARIATPERTETYVSIHDKGADKVLRQIAPSD